ncbi:MAG: CRTAC1 family protein [Planctomycetes bacterium]|nr:CRTAC1 family protein [Planctomycetota bacterium]
MSSRLLRVALWGGGALLLVALALGWYLRGSKERHWRSLAAGGTAGMAALLDELAREAAPSACADAFEHDVAQRRTLHASGAPLQDEARAQMRLGLDLIKLGDPLAAAEELERATQAAARDASLPPNFHRELALARATAWLRIAEVENCLDCCNGASCLAPIEPAGVHQKPRGAERAFAEFLALVESDPGDDDSRWLLNLAAMTLGRWPDGVPEPHRLAPERFASDAPFPRWRNVAADCGLDTRSIAGGAIAEDFDRDGCLDVMTSAQGLRDPLRYYRNDGAGRFVERSREAGLDGIVGGLNLIHGDYDNDGFPDVLVLRGAWLKEGGRLPNSLLRNRGDGTFEDVTARAGLLSFHPTQTACFADFDGDGWLDLFIGNETWSESAPHPCELYRNDGRGGFVECAAAAGVDVQAYVKGVCAGDFDDDGRPDLYVSCRERSNRLFRNEATRAAPGWRFVDVTERAGVARPRASFACWFFDYDQDGRQDLFAAPNAGFGNTPDDVGKFLFGKPTASDRPVLYRNLGDGRFEDVAPQLGLDRAILVMGANFGDLDNDGFEDVYLGTGNPSFRALLPNRMFRNDGGRRFLDVTTAGGFGHLQKGHGVAFADFDDDGDQDLFHELGGQFPGDTFAHALFENPTQGARWITLELEGVRANRSAIGARLALELETPAGPRTLHREVGTGGSFGSSSLQQEIGLGDATALRAVTIRWPGSGTVQRFVDVPLERRWRAREGEPALQPIERRPVTLGGAASGG